MNKYILDNDYGNVKHVCDIVEKVHSRYSGGYWFITDISINPKYKGDYSGSGGENPINLSYDLLKTVETERAAILSTEDLIAVLEDTLTIDDAVMLYFPNNIKIDKYFFRPVVEPNDYTKINHKDALYEIRILESCLFTIFDNIKV